MKGDMGLLDPNMINNAETTSMTMIGTSHQALLIFKKSQISASKGLFFGMDIPPTVV